MEDGCVGEGGQQGIQRRGVTRQGATGGEEWFLYIDTYIEQAKNCEVLVQIFGVLTRLSRTKNTITHQLPHANATRNPYGAGDGASSGLWDLL